MSSQYERYPTPTPAEHKEPTSATTIDGFFDRPRTRRNVLGMLASVVPVGYMLLHEDTRFAREHYSQHDLGIEMTKPSIDKMYEHHATVFIPPFNFLSAAPFAEAVQDTVAQYGNVAALTHDSRGFSIDDCVNELRAFIEKNNLNTVSLCGSSIGGLIATVLATRVPEVTHLAIDSGPANVGTIKDLPEFLPVKLSAALDRLDLTGGPVVRSTFEFIKRVQDGDKSLQRCISEAMQGLDPNECPNGVDIDLFLFLWTHDALTQQSRLSRPIDIDYMGATDPDRDGLVDQEASSADYRELANSIGGHFTMHTSDEVGHSDIPHHPAAFQRMFQAAFTYRASRLTQLREEDHKITGYTK